MAGARAARELGGVPHAQICACGARRERRRGRALGMHAGLDGRRAWSAATRSSAGVGAAAAMRAKEG